MTIYFSVLDLGYGGAMVKFVAQYRAHRDARALNEIASTLFVIFARDRRRRLPVVSALAFNIQHVFNLDARRRRATGRWILLIIGVNVALNFPFSVFGGIINGFQRYDLQQHGRRRQQRGVAAVNVVMVLLGLRRWCSSWWRRPRCGSPTYFVYRLQRLPRLPGAAHPAVAVPARARLREVTSFSVYSSIIDWANKLNYELDEIVIGVFLGAAPVAIWAVADRVISGTQRLTNQVNGVLFPVVVDSRRRRRSRSGCSALLLEGTRLSLATRGAASRSC